MSSSALQYALRLLKRRFMSAWEIDQALVRRQVDREERQAVLAELTDLRLLDDLRFAKAFVHDRDRFSPRSRWLLGQELVQKGVAREVIEQVLELHHREELGVDDFSLALHLAERHSRRLLGLDYESYNRRLSAALSRKGFSTAIIARVLAEHKTRRLRQ